MAARSKVAKTTIIDIAAASGVSVATVSRILNNKPDVADETRERVLRVMNEIGFAPQSAWRQIRLGRTGLIAVHRPEQFNPPAYGIVTAAALAVEEAGYSINIVTRTLSDAELLGIFRSRQADGIILLEIQPDDRRAEILRDHGYPFVMVGRRAENAGLSFADMDIEHGITEAMEHLLSLGHRQIGLLTIDPVAGEKVHGFAMWALNSYREACANAGIQPIVVMTEPTSEAATAAAARMLDASREVTAVIAPQEHSVIGILKVCYARGIVIPRDLSLVAVLREGLSDLATPPLTAITFPVDDLGRTAGRLLTERLGGGPSVPPRQVLLRPELVIRGTTAAPH